MTVRRWLPRGCLALAWALAVATAMPMPTLTAQSVSIRTAGGALGVHAPEFAFIEGAVLNRLRDGQSVQLELTMLVLARPDGPTLAEARQRYRLSFDLWEERIAVTRVATPPRAVSHLRPRDAEAWCLENLTVPVGATGRKAKEPFWIRLVFQVAEEPPAQESSSEVSLLHTMIDKLSGRRSAGPLSKSMDAGPFSLSD